VKSESSMLPLHRSILLPSSRYEEDIVLDGDWNRGPACRFFSPCTNLGVREDEFVMDLAGVGVVEAKRGSEMTKRTEVKRARRALGFQTSNQNCKEGCRGDVEMMDGLESAT